MPELAGVQHAPIDDPTRAATPLFPIPWPGYPQGLEQMSAFELAYWGQRFGLDTPYLYAPSGWGEIVPLIGFDFAGVTPGSILVLNPDGSAYAPAL